MNEVPGDRVLLWKWLLDRRWALRASAWRTFQRTCNPGSSGRRGRSVTGCFQVKLWSRAKVHERREKAPQLDLEELLEKP
jgi:hypothetical protein